MWLPKGVALVRGRRLFEARRLLEEIRHLFKINDLLVNFHYVAPLLIPFICHAKVIHKQK